MLQRKLLANTKKYEEIVQEMIDRKQGHINRAILGPLIKAIEIIEPVTHVEICRDPDDNKFLECAKDSHALYIVSGDNDPVSYSHLTLPTTSRV